MMAKKGGSALGVLALLIAIGALGLQVYHIYINPPQIETGEEIGGTWYASETDYFRTSILNTDMVFATLNISFEVKAGQSTYFLYSGRAYLDLTYDGFSELKIYFSIDGYKIDEPNIWERFWYSFSDMGGNSMLRTVSLQYGNSTILPGIHNVTMILEGNFGFNGVSDSSLFVQTYYS